MRIFDKLKQFNAKITEIRNKNIAKRENKVRVKKLIDGGSTPHLSEEVIKLQTKFGLTQDEAETYLKDKEKKENRNAMLRKVAHDLSEVGANARRLTNRDMTGQFTIQKPDITRTKPRF